ncbi:MAG TPA: acetyl-CoA carboxylase biotin carboxylase subunit [Acidimicrobiia bacterium]|nr:acetyl-CoA carboxylase biotin carboxylase subunit [Acidimicrobiia bacterium]
MKSLLVANRGEIAVRVIRTAREMGIRTIAVFSELDRDALHVDLADEAWNAGAAPASESYLNQESILRIAHESGAEAIHPGYGFLSENATFARAVEEAGIIWVGPSGDAIEAMGDKITSRRNAESYGVPTVPGITDPVTTIEEVYLIAEEFGYPVAIKAAHGGGGKGLRVVRSDKEVADAFDGARREADAYFGNSEVYVEKYLEKSRHIEAQVLFDTHGNGLFLGERDCSVQRRHQKLIEETPAPGLTSKQRKTLARAAIDAGKSCDYVNAGTVEFLMDRNGDFYFLEMNTRLQVEHTVTEMVTGLDLVAWQLRIARGERLEIKDAEPRGHAIEFRINAEDPFNGYLPTPGQVVEWEEPAGPGVRVDSWIRPGTSVSQYYDNLMAKLVVWGPDRESAINRGRRALEEFTVRGVSTTIPAHLAVLAHEDFITGKHHTKWMEDVLSLESSEPTVAPTLPEEEELTKRDITVEIGGRRFRVTYWAPEPTAAGQMRRRPPRLAASGKSDVADGVIAAPMQGTIVKVHVKAGDTVGAGDPICVLEAMKMENEVTAPAAGDIVDLRVEPGDTVASGQVIAIVR